MNIPVSDSPNFTPSSENTGLAPNDDFDLVGLIPAAGHARRLGPQTHSKEILNVADPQRPDNNPVAGYLLRQMAAAGCSRACFIVRSGKWDIADTFGAQSAGLPLAYLTIDDSWGPPFTLAAALPFVRGAGVTTGFPDILIDPPDAMAQIVARLRASDADVTLASFAAEPADGCDHIDIAEDGTVVKITPKEFNPVWAANSKTWLLAAWRPRFSAFFSASLAEFSREMAAAPADEKKDLPMGSVLVKALARGYKINSLHFPDGRFIDIGTPERLATATGFFNDPQTVSRQPR